MKKRRWIFISLGIGALACGNASEYRPVCSEFPATNQTCADYLRTYTEGRHGPPVATSPSLLSQIIYPELGDVQWFPGSKSVNTTPPKMGVDGYPLPQWISESQTVGQGVGYKSGYIAVDMFFAPNYPDRKFLPFIQLGGYRLYSPSYLGGGVGVGTRYLPSYRPFIVGVNAFYNYSQTHFAPIHQLEGGVEIFGLRWGLWVNGYWPVHGRWHQRKERFTYPGGYSAVCKQFSAAFAGFNIIANRMVYQKGSFLVTLWGEAYHLSGGMLAPFWGGKFTVQPQYKDYVSMTFGMSRDPVFGTLLQGGITFTLPLYRYSSLKRQKSSGGFANWQVYQPIPRLKVLPQRGGCCWDFNW